MKNSDAIGDYNLLSFCGKGAYGDVWLVKDAADRTMALKRINKKRLGSSWKNEFEGVVNFCKNTKLHQNLLNVYHVADEEDYFYYTMEAADNLLPAEFGAYKPDTLAARLQNGRIEFDELIPLTLHILDGLDALHHRGLVHRDIKPSNIVFVDGIPKLSDIGLVSRINKNSSLAGTPDFFPLNDPDASGQPKSDIYAVGKLLYCCMTGNSPEKYPSIPLELCRYYGYREMNKTIQKVCHRIKERRIIDSGELRKRLLQIDKRSQNINDCNHYVKSFQDFVYRQNCKRNYITGILILVALMLLYFICNFNWTFRSFYNRTNQAKLPLFNNKQRNMVKVNNKKWSELGAFRQHADSQKQELCKDSTIPALDTHNYLIFSDKLSEQLSTACDILMMPKSAVTIDKETQIQANGIFELNLPYINLTESLEINIAVQMKDQHSILSFYLYSKQRSAQIYLGEFCFWDHIRFDFYNGEQQLPHCEAFWMKNKMLCPLPNLYPKRKPVVTNNFCIYRIIKKGKMFSVYQDKQLCFVFKIPANIFLNRKMRIALIAKTEQGSIKLKDLNIYGNQN